ncbi:MAG: UDP-N-acetyl-D-glucosamine dehydrogenase [Nitrospirae bacterium GWD2_57_9]|nr:MAG: UDP-N-acetyl-D-glucosamine dehydrogenase [Nitrospirae bacterium GWD2_57_9]
MKKIKVGVVGVGYLGQFHAEKYAAMPEVDLVGVVDTDPERGQLIAQKLSTRWFPEPALLLGRVDAVSIVVPTAFHHRVALPFLEQGVHVLLEKPVTVTLDQADEVIAVSDRTNAVLQIGHIERFNPAVTSIKKLLTSPRYITAERAAPFTVRCTDVNVILDLMIHDLDIVVDLAGSDPKEISAAGASVITTETDTATARIVFENGCIADVTASRVSDEKKRMLRVFDGDNLYTSDYQTQKATVSRKAGDRVVELVAKDIATERRDTLNEEIRSFVHCIGTGTRPLVSGREGRRALALATLITRNITSGMSGFVPFT